MSKNNQTFQRNILRYIALLFALLLCKDIRASDTPFANGNLTKDSNKGISSITYNCLNLPGKVTFSNGNSVTYTYAADGTKLKVVYVIGAATVTDYFCDNVIYEGGTQKYLLNEEGYYNLSSSTYCYYLRDHQGNNRVVINSSGTVQETNHYYPFGGLFATTSTQPYKYNGKELMTKNGLAWYDYGARHYDPALGRFVTGDPMAEKLYGNSLYSYASNNPTNKIDPNGMLDNWVEDINKKIYWDANATSQATTKVGETYLGKAVVVFEGSTDERLGAKSNFFGEGANLANVTFYTPQGSTAKYKGYTMSSDPNLFGVVADGDYEVSRIEKNAKRGPYNSEWTLNKRGEVPAMNNYNPAYPGRNPGYLTGVFIHRPNYNGFSGTYWSDKKQRIAGVSEGCLLIAPNEWNSFEQQLIGIDVFRLKLYRK